MSDWLEEADGVFRGGGVKGLALAGALQGFADHETKPVHKWVNVAGASAGAIIACYLACGHDANDMVELMRRTNFEAFQDFPAGGKFVGGAYNMLVHHGLAHGNAFRDWFSEQLEHKTFAATKTDDGEYRLKLIAADVTNRALLVLPDDLPLYRLPGQKRPIDPDQFEIADAARMSMSIPYFFEPITLIRDDNGRESTIVDGGTLSNFPVWIFDVGEGTPCRPTFGFTLKGGHGVGDGLHKLEKAGPWAVDLAFDIFHTAQEAWDARFVSHSTRVRTLAVDAADVATTDFDLSPAKQQLLLDNGVAAAREFLAGFELADYLNTFHRKLDVEPAAVTVA